MKSKLAVISLAAAGSLSLLAQPSLTIYNQNFAVVRDKVPLDLQSGVNAIRFAGATAQVEPDTVMLRDSGGQTSLQILEQNYRNDPVSQELLLSLFEGRTIEFEHTHTQNGAPAREIISGKIIRSGFVPGGGAEQPIVEVSGKLRFSLPGLPMFPSLGDDTVLKPTLNWLIQSDRAVKLDAEVSYVTGGVTWEGDYNLVAPEKGDVVDLTGWITMNNRSGKTFENAKIKLMAGDVQKILPISRAATYYGGGRGGGGGAPSVTEKTFDEYHLYTLERPATLRDREAKQIEFVRGTGVKALVIYVYDGVQSGIRFSGGVNDDRNYGTDGNKKVWIVREFVNGETNHLGLPLPKGKVRFYRRNDDGQLEFTGEDTIDHTPRNETVRVTTGSSFDLVGERKQTDFKMYLLNPPAAIDPATGLPIIPEQSQRKSSVRKSATDNEPPPWINESFDIKLRNHKRESVEVRVVEHLYRWSNWEIKKKSHPFLKTDAQTIEFRLKVKPEEETTVSYTVHYAW